MYFFAVVLAENNIDENAIQCSIWAKDHLEDTSEMHGIDTSFRFVKIDKFDDLKFSVSCSKFPLNTNFLKVCATSKVLMENTFDYAHLISLFSYIDNQTMPVTIFLQNLNGFNENLFEPNLISLDQGFMQHVEVEMINIKFDFYKNGSLITKETCVYDSNRKSFFSSIKVMEVITVIYGVKICPFIFTNTKLESLGLYQITNSLIFSNRLEFIDINATESQLNTQSLTYLKLSVAYERITLTCVNRHVFNNLKFLFLQGFVESIDSEIFHHLNKLRLIHICIDNFWRFFHAGTKWMSHLNSDLNVNLNLKNEISKYSHRILTLEFLEEYQPLKLSYSYPDEDICLFRNFPHKSLVVPVIVLDDESVTKCTCTLIWLLQYSTRYIVKEMFHYSNNYIYAEYADENLTAKMFCLRNRNFHKLFIACNFTQKFATCLNTPTTSLSLITLNGNLSLFYFFKWLQLIVEFYFQLIFCLFGLFTNFLSICVICNRRQTKHFQNPMYKHILFNAWFNICLCIIYVMSLMNICVFPKSSFCSSVLKYEASQYLKIYLVYFLGNCLKLCCNFSYIFFTLSRGVLSTETRESKLRKFFENLNVNTFYLFIFICCTCFSLYKVFEYRPNEFYSSFENSFPYNVYDLRFCEHMVINQNDKYSPNMCRLMWGLNLVNNLLNNVAFLFLSVIIDVVMIRFSNSLIRQKRHLNSPHLTDAIKFKEELNKMILVNGTLYFFSHIPEFVVTLLLIGFKQRFASFCYVGFSCSELIEMAQKIHLVPIAGQFFIFYHFDHNFIQSFDDLKKRLFKKK